MEKQESRAKGVPRSPTLPVFSALLELCSRKLRRVTPSHHLQMWVTEMISPLGDGNPEFSGFAWE